ncbi:MAG: VTT domain-containing protein [Chitinophagaceae bacterium]|nr:VTT domain-containing protein [Chitinophagaceae bacterium]MCW5905709.1 VTT domain-containing protein [Chitinophagaceae bacterium]
MDVVIEFFKHLLDPDWIMKNGGLYLVLLILFIETGVFFGFLLPGDPLLFISGMVIASVNEAHYPFSSAMLNLPFWMLLFMASTIVGNYFGYWFGKKFKFLIDRPEGTWFLKRKHIDTAHAFYEKRGGLTILIARFLPIIRTFAPIIAGTVKMDYKKFAFYNIAGAILWVGSLTSLGYILGDNVWVKKNLEYVMLGIIVIVTTPVIIKLFVKKEKLA